MVDFSPIILQCFPVAAQREGLSPAAFHGLRLGW